MIGMIGMLTINNRSPPSSDNNCYHNRRTLSLAGTYTMKTALFAETTPVSHNEDPVLSSLFARGKNSFFALRSSLFDDRQRRALIFCGIHQAGQHRLILSPSPRRHSPATTGIHQT